MKEELKEIYFPIDRKIKLLLCPTAHLGEEDLQKIFSVNGLKIWKNSSSSSFNWLIMKQEVVAIPKAIKIEHLKENAESTGWRLSKEDILQIEKHFS